MIPFDFDDQDEPTSRPAGDDEVEGEGYDDAAGDWDEDEDEDDAAIAGSGAMQQVHEYLVELSKDELVAFVERMAAQDAVVLKALTEQVATARGPTADLLRGARTTIDNVSIDAIYQGDAPSTGELGRLRDRLDTLVARGRADDVLVLCERLLRRANRAVAAMEETDDGFFTAIHHALGVIPDALARSSKDPVAQMLWLRELELSEDYELLPEMDDFWDEDRAVDVWNDLAARVEERLAARMPDPSTAASPYGLHRTRDAWTNMLAYALGHAGRDDEVAQLYEREAETTGSYQRLVSHLLDAGDLERAEHWIRRGIAATSEQQYGNTDQLRRELRAIRERQGDAAGIAALDAYDYCTRPSLAAFQVLLQSAEAAGCHEPVRLHALRFLETLILPWKRPDPKDPSPVAADTAGDGSSAVPEAVPADLPPWPLPSTGLPDPGRSRYEQPPLARELLEVALAEGRLDDVLVWFDIQRAHRSGGYYFGDQSATVARAVERSHPERAIAIWEDLAARAIGRTQTEAYHEAARYLESAGRIEERRGNLAVWRERTLELQARERRKYRLREILGDLLTRFPPP